MQAIYCLMPSSGTWIVLHEVYLLGFTHLLKLSLLFLELFAYFKLYVCITSQG